jgi:hypothetical protein
MVLITRWIFVFYGQVFRVGEDEDRGFSKMVTSLVYLNTPVPNNLSLFDIK